MGGAGSRSARDKMDTGWTADQISLSPNIRYTEALLQSLRGKPVDQVGPINEDDDDYLSQGGVSTELIAAQHECSVTGDEMRSQVEEERLAMVAALTQTQEERMMQEVEGLRKKLGLDKLQEERPHPCKPQENSMMKCLRLQDAEQEKGDILRCSRFVADFNKCVIEKSEFVSIVEK